MRIIPIVSLGMLRHGNSAAKRDEALVASPPVYRRAAIPTAGSPQSPGPQWGRARLSPPISGQDQEHRMTSRGLGNPL
jgi:hypothetical protein